MADQGLGYLTRTPKHQLETLLRGQSAQVGQLELQLSFLVVVAQFENLAHGVFIPGDSHHAIDRIWVHHILLRRA
jgi:hypothetical protein